MKYNALLTLLTVAQSVIETGSRDNLYSWDSVEWSYGFSILKTENNIDIKFVDGGTIYFRSYSFYDFGGTNVLFKLLPKTLTEIGSYSFFGATNGNNLSSISKVTKIDELEFERTTIPLSL